MFLGWQTRFPHENNAILHSFFHGVPLFRLGLILGAFWGVSGVLPAARWDPSGPQLGHLAASWVSWVASWQPWGALWDQFGLQLGDFVPSWKPCDANLGISWVTLSPLGSDLASFGYLVCESSCLPYLWMPLVEFVGIGEAGLDLCQCVSIGAELHTKPNAHTCATYLYMCTCWCTKWHVRLLHQTIENY